MLAADRAVEGEPETHDVVEGLPRPSPAVGVVTDVDDRRMQVAVAGVTTHRDRDPAPVGDVEGAADELAQPADGHTDVLRDAGTQGLERRAHDPAPFEQHLRLAGVIGHRDLGSACRSEQLGVAGHVVGDVVGAVGLHEQHGFGVVGKAVVAEGLHGADAAAVHDLEQTGSVPVTAQGQDAGHRIVQRGEHRQRGQGRVGRRLQAHDDLGECALRRVEFGEPPRKVWATDL